MSANSLVTQALQLQTLDKLWKIIPESKSEWADFGALIDNDSQISSSGSEDYI